MKTTKWRVQHESGTITEISPRDLRGTRLLQECGYEWVNRGDGRGWRQLVFVVTEMEVALAVVGGAQ